MSHDPCTRRPTSEPTGEHRLPRAHVDPIDHEATALALLAAVVSEPPRSETIIVLLDRERRGMSIIVVDGTLDHDAVIHTVEAISTAAAAGTDVGALVVASVRPTDQFDDLLDADRWLHLDEIADQHGLDLVEWFVFHGAWADRISRPRELLDEPQRWSPTPPHDAARSA